MPLQSRDEQGHVLAIFECSSADGIEALACREGVRLAVEWIHKRAILETDCVSVASAINSCYLSRL